MLRRIPSLRSNQNPCFIYLLSELFNYEIKNASEVFSNIVLLLQDDRIVSLKLQICKGLESALELNRILKLFKSYVIGNPLVLSACQV